MSIEWFYAPGGEKSGPHTEQEMLAFVEAGKIVDSTLCWQKGYGTTWKPFFQTELPIALTRAMAAVPPPLPITTFGGGPSRRGWLAILGAVVIIVAAQALGTVQPAGLPLCDSDYAASEVVNTFDSIVPIKHAEIKALMLLAQLYVAVDGHLGR